MVYLNLSDDIKSENQNKINYAPAFSRFFSAILDYFIFAPVVTFFIVLFFRDSVQIMTHSSVDSVNIIILQLAVFAVLLLTGLQTVFIYFHRATPGQSFLKLYMSFEQESSNLFFQIWFRQIGFVLSVAGLGLPFLAVIYHNKHRAFYDRFSECDVLKLGVVEDTVTAFPIYETDKKYLSASVSAFLCFTSVIFIFAVFQSHTTLLHKVQVADGKTSPVKKCLQIENQTQEERLKTVLALNILNLTSDDCTLSEADAVFNQMKMGQNETKEVKDVSLAYFIKFYIAQKTADGSLIQAEYFKYACAHGVKSDLCSAVEGRNIASENNKKVSLQKLNERLLESIGKVKK